MKIDELRAAIEAKYKPFEVELTDQSKVKLRAPLRLNDAEREAVLKYMEGLQGLEDAEGIADSEVLNRSKGYLTEILRIVAAPRGEDLLSELADDYLLIMEVFSEWSRATQAPEADSSSEQSNDRMGLSSQTSNDSTESTSSTYSTVTSLQSTH